MIRKSSFKISTEERIPSFINAQYEDGAKIEWL